MEKVFVWACSGAANTGLLTDRVARKLRDEGKVSMSCLAGVGAGLENYTKTAAENPCLVIDGCPVNCGKKIFEAAGFAPRVVTVTDLGVVKGETKITDEVVADISARIASSVLTP